MSIQDKVKTTVDSTFNQLETNVGVQIRQFKEEDFMSIQQLYEKEAWFTIIKSPKEGLAVFNNSNPVLVAINGNKIIGVIRALTDKQITIYIVELLISEDFRGKGIGENLIEACHSLYPNTRLEVLATDKSKSFYNSIGFRDFYGLRKSYY